MNKLSKLALLDKTAVQRLRGLNQSDSDDFALELIQEFLVKSPAKLSLMDQDMTAGNLSAVYQEAHALKSASAAIGAMRLAQVAERLETSSHSNLKKRAEQDYFILLKIYKITQEALQKFCETNTFE